MTRAIVPSAALAALAAALAGLGACSSDDYVVVTVSARPAVSHVAKLNVTVSTGSATLTDTLDFTGHEFPSTFSLEEKSTGTPLSVAIAAVDDDGNPVGNGSAAIAAGETSATVTLDSVDFVVNTDYPMDQTLNGNFYAVGVQLAATPDQVWTVGFRDNCASPCNVFGRRFDDTGQPVSTELGAGTNQFALSTTEAIASSEITPALATGSGVTLAVWDSHVDDGLGDGGVIDGISCRVLDARGSSDDFETPILTGSNLDTVSAVGLADGNFAMTWEQENTTSGDFEIRGAVIGSDCSVVDPSVAISAAGEVVPHGSHVATNAASVLFAWIDDSDVHIAVTDLSLHLTTSNITLVSGTASDDADYVRVAPLGSGFAVAIRWAAEDGTSPGRIEVWPVDTSGSATSGPILVTDQSQSDFQSIDSFTVASRSDGALLVSWSACQAGGDGQGCGVFGAVLRPTGVPVGSPFTIPTTLVGDQLDPSAIALTDAFVVAWDDDSQQAPDVSGFAVRARIIYPPYDDAVGVNGAACGSSSPSGAGCNGGLMCAPGTDGERCFFPCDGSNTCPQGGTCTDGACVF